MLFKKNFKLLGLITLAFLLVFSSSVFASSTTSTNGVAPSNNDVTSSANAGPSQMVQPDGVTLSWVGAYISKNTGGTALWYSGNVSSNYSWVSASSQVNLQWQSPLGGSWLTEVTQPTVYSENVAYMETPTYFMNYPTWGYWRSKNYAVIYWPPGQIPSSSTGTDISSAIYIEP